MNQYTIYHIKFRLKQNNVSNNNRTYSYRLDFDHSLIKITDNNTIQPKHEEVESSKHNLAQLLQTQFISIRNSIT